MKLKQIILDARLNGFFVSRHLSSICPLLMCIVTDKRGLSCVIKLSSHINSAFAYRYRKAIFINYVVEKQNQNHQNHR